MGPVGHIVQDTGTVPTHRFIVYDSIDNFHIYAVREYFPQRVNGLRVIVSIAQKFDITENTVGFLAKKKCSLHKENKCEA
jgi:hypothetical protein